MKHDCDFHPHMPRSPTEINLAYSHSPCFLDCWLKVPFQIANISCSSSVFLSCWCTIPLCFPLSPLRLCLSGWCLPFLPHSLYCLPFPTALSLLSFLSNWCVFFPSTINPALLKALTHQLKATVGDCSLKPFTYVFSVNLIFLGGGVE